MKTKLSPWEKLIKYHKKLLAMKPSEFMNLTIFVTWILTALFVDLKLQTAQNVSLFIMFGNVMYELLWFIDCCIFTYRKRKFEKTELFNTIIKEEKQEYLKEMEKEL